MLNETSPLEREILTHYWVSPEPWVPMTGLHKEIIDGFIARGLLVFDHEAGIRANREALEPYMDALARVPLPVMKWVIPETAAAVRERAAVATTKDEASDVV